jgi:hypothetical protein
MATISINNYNASTGQLYFSANTLYNEPLYAEKSLDSGSTWLPLGLAVDTPTGPYFTNVVTDFRIRTIEINSGSDDSVYSNIYNYDPFAPAVYDVTRTPIENETDISFCNSPIHLKIANDLQDASIQSAFVYLWIWTGDQNKTLGQPTQVLYAEKISSNDNYINFEISEYVKAYLIAPDLAPNTNQPNFAYNELSDSVITGQGIFWQIIADVTSTGGTLRKNYRTSFATLGYRYDWEQSANIPYQSILPFYPKYWNPQIHNYFQQFFNFEVAVNDATTANIIFREDPFLPNEFLRTALDPFLIVYLAKDGLFRCFTPNGKATFDNKIKRTESNLSFRNPSSIDNAYYHSKMTDNFEVEQTITINTGILEAEMVEEVRQIVLSPKIYLIDFLGDVQDNSTVGITIDDNFTSIDNLIISIDSMTVGANYLGYYKTHRQIPVILTDTDFQIKTRLNDKNKIDYNLKFEITTNLINDLR